MGSVITDAYQDVEQPTWTPDGRLPKLLIVDDQPINIQVLYRLFADKHQVFMATGGEQAMAKVAADPPDLILLDWVMPGMDGYQVCQALKQNPDTRDIPVLFVTASHDPEQETKALEGGGVDFITKPVNPAAVQARVRTHLTLKFQADLLKRMAFLDGLTGIYNRRFFDDRIRAEVGRAERDGSSLGLMLIDVDHFKQFNDLYGHLAGDDCLRLVAKALHHNVMRPGDVVVRYGGEEFACLLPNTDLAGAQQVGHKLIEAIAHLGIPHAGSSVSTVVTASAGLVMTSPSRRLDPAQLIAAADARLYEAKRLGRARLSSDENG